MTTSKFTGDLVRKGRRALRSAQVDLNDGDADGSVNRSYYAMFNIARAALLSDGTAEKDLPRTHNGVIAAFSQHAVPGRIDAELAAALGRAESHRLRADYSGIEISLKDARKILDRAKIFVSTVESVFALEDSLKSIALEDKPSDPNDKISEPNHDLQPISLEETRRQARENWLLLRAQQFEGTKNLDQSQRSKGEDNHNQSHSLGDDDE